MLEHELRRVTPSFSLRRVGAVGEIAEERNGTILVRTAIANALRVSK
jgi:hypothetical protein